MGSESSTFLRRIWSNGVAGSHAFPHSVRARMLRLSGFEVGSAVILAGVKFRSADIHIGDGVFINHDCIIDGRRIDIEDRVYFGPRVTIAGVDHELGPAEQRAGANVEYDVRIGAGSWLGAHVVVLAGVTIAPGCVIGAGAVVTKDTEPNGVYVGVPAKRIRDLD
jgi:maltose O-acetyltransferase